MTIINKYECLSQFLDISIHTILSEQCCTEVLYAAILVLILFYYMHAIIFLTLFHKHGSSEPNAKTFLVHERGIYNANYSHWALYSPCFTTSFPKVGTKNFRIHGGGFWDM